MWVEKFIAYAECEQYDIPKTSLLGSYKRKISPNAPALQYSSDVRWRKFVDQMVHNTIIRLFLIKK